MNILLGVCGSISAYKAYDIARGLVKSGHQVRVVLTQGALQFVHKNVFSYLGAEMVYGPRDDFNEFSGPVSQEGSGNFIRHIELCKWASTILILPASANTISKLSLGLADDLLSTLFLARDFKIPTIIYPAMNPQMYQNPIVKDNLARLLNLPGLYLHPPAKGEMACGDIGEGKLPPVEEILATFSLFNDRREDKKILISTGATIAPIDPVRYLTNPASGLTGFLLAHEALSRGYEVHVVAGIFSCTQLDWPKCHPRYQITRITTTREMREVILNNIDQYDAYISSAAISDIEFDFSHEKMKKSNLNGKLLFRQAPDVLKEVLARKKENLKVVGFAAETDLCDRNLFNKLSDKPVDLLVGTKVDNGFSSHQEPLGFSASSANYRLFEKKGPLFEGNLKKNQLAKKIFEILFPQST